jgi:CheY-like chemotaxis protein
MAILIVDDDDDIRASLLQLLQAEGYVALAAANGEEALELLRQPGHQICLVLLDLMMPVMNGWEFLDHVAHDGSLAAIPVAIMSAHASVQAPKSQQLGASKAFLAKPFTVDQLLGVADQFCRNEQST